MLRRFSCSRSLRQLPSFYDTKVEEYAARPITMLTLQELQSWKASPEATLTVKKELPVRIARIIRDIQQLPFIIGMNPHVRHVYMLYLDSFERLRTYDGQDFAEQLQMMVESHSQIVPTLAMGMAECRPFLNKNLVTSFLNRTIRARIGIRVLAEHYLALQTPTKDHVGILNQRARPREILQRKIIPQAQQLADFNFGFHPEIHIEGDIEFPYIEVHLEYVFMELIKNSIRATVDHCHKLGYIGNTDGHGIHITLSDGSKAQEMGNACIRIRDLGGGIPQDKLEQVWEYSYSTVHEQEPDNPLTATTQMAVEQGTGGPMAGLGYGLAMSRIYAEYTGGSLQLVSMPDHGVDVFVRLPHIRQLNI